MTLEEIKKAVLFDKNVKWKQDNYDVIYSNLFGEFLIVCTNNKHCIGLTHQDGKTLNGNEDEFYIEEKV